MSEKLVFKNYLSSFVLLQMREFVFTVCVYSLCLHIRVDESGILVVLKSNKRGEWINSLESRGGHIC